MSSRKVRLGLAAALALVIVSAAFALRASMTSNKAVLHVKPEATFTPEDSYIGSLVTWDHYVAWMGYADLSGKGARISIYDLQTKKIKVLAKDFTAKGPSWVRGSERVLIYMSFARLPCDDFPEGKKDPGCPSKPRPWQMLLVDVSSGKQTQIAASKAPADETYPPLPELSYPYVVWANPPSEASPQAAAHGIVVYDLKTKEKKVVLPGMIVARATIEGDTLVFSAAVPGAGKWDLFSASIKGKRARRLTASGKAIFPRASDGFVAWHEILPTAKGQTQTDSSPWVARVSGKGRPARLAPKGSNPTPGDGFVAWVALPADGGQLLIRDNQAKTQPVVVEQQPNFAAGWWAYRDRLVWATVLQQGTKVTSVIHVASIAFK